MCFFVLRRVFSRVLPCVGSREMAGGHCSAVLGMQGRRFLGGRGHDFVGFSQQAITGVAEAHMFFTCICSYV